MKKPKVGLISMGSRENRPKWADLISALQPELEVEIAGVLDGLTEEETKNAYGFSAGENYIVTDMPWGVVHISEEKAKKRVKILAESFLENGADTVLVLCTGHFDRPETGKGLFVMPEDIIFGLMSGLKQKKLGFVVPEDGQIESSVKHYSSLNPVVLASSPYGSMEQLRDTAEKFHDLPVEVIVTDCMGFTAEMGRIVAETSGKQVLVPRLVLPKLIKALLLQL